MKRIEQLIKKGIMPKKCFMGGFYAPEAKVCRKCALKEDYEYLECGIFSGWFWRAYTDRLAYYNSLKQK